VEARFIRDDLPNEAARADARALTDAWSLNAAAAEGTSAKSSSSNIAKLLLALFVLTAERLEARSASGVGSSALLAFASDEMISAADLARFAARDMLREIQTIKNRYRKSTRMHTQLQHRDSHCVIGANFLLAFGQMLT